MSAQGYEDLAWAAAYGHETGGWKPSPVSWAAFDLIVNTIPAQVLDRRRLQWVNPGAFLLDLASAPGVWTGQRPRTGPAGPSGAGAARTDGPCHCGSGHPGFCLSHSLGIGGVRTMGDARVGFALTGSFCTLEKAIRAMEETAREYPNMVPILSETTGPQTPGLAGRRTSDRRRRKSAAMARWSRCGRRSPSAQTAAGCAGHRPLHREQFLAKLANGIADTSVTMAAKAHLRNGRPVVVAVSTNDGLAGARKHRELLCRKHYYFVPFRQDDLVGKPTSPGGDMTKGDRNGTAALRGEQLQPLLLGPADSEAKPGRD